MLNKKADFFKSAFLFSILQKVFTNKPAKLSFDDTINVLTNIRGFYEGTLSFRVDCDIPYIGGNDNCYDFQTEKISRENRFQSFQCFTLDYHSACRKLSCIVYRS